MGAMTSRDASWRDVGDMPLRNFAARSLPLGAFNREELVPRGLEHHLRGGEADDFAVSVADRPPGARGARRRVARPRWYATREQHPLAHLTAPSPRCRGLG